MTALAQKLYTPEEYLELERKAEYKSEYLDGRIYAMSGASLAHDTIVTNLIRIIGNEFEERPCRLFSADMRVKVAPNGLYTYPDVSAVCGELVFDDTEMDTLTNPTVIFEVLSPSTEAYDRGKKFEYYRKLQSLQEYVLVVQHRPLVEHYVRRNDNWVLSDLDALDTVLGLPSIGCSIALSDIYRKVDFGTNEQTNNHSGAQNANRNT